MDCGAKSTLRYFSCPLLYTPHPLSGRLEQARENQIDKSKEEAKNIKHITHISYHVSHEYCLQDYTVLYTACDFDDLLFH